MNIFFTFSKNIYKNKENICTYERISQLPDRTGIINMAHNSIQAMLMDWA
jgi:hypothetical protein